MTPTERAVLRQQLIDHEGRRLKPYVDTVGKVTIGVGRNLTDVGLSQQEVLDLLENDVTKVESSVLKALPWVKTLDFTRQLVLYDMAFNLGTEGLLKFQRMLAAVLDSRYNDAATEMLSSKWANQVGKRAVTLATMMRSGTPTKDLSV